MALRTLLTRIGLEAARFAGTALGMVTGPRRLVSEVFPELGAGRARRVAAAIEGQRVVAFALRRVSRRLGDAWLVDMTRVEGGERLEALRRQGRPAVVLSWHAGLGPVVLTGLAQLGFGGVVIRRDLARAHQVVGFRDLVVPIDSQGRAVALVRALEALRRGELVVGFLSVAPPAQTGPNSSFLGRATTIREGPAGLARLGDAALILVDTRLERGRPVLEILPPVEVGPGDLDTIRRVARIYEERLRRDPGRLWRTDIEDFVSRTQAP